LRSSFGPCTVIAPGVADEGRPTSGRVSSSTRPVSHQLRGCFSKLTRLLGSRVGLRKWRYTPMRVSSMVPSSDMSGNDKRCDRQAGRTMPRNMFRFGSFSPADSAERWCHASAHRRGPPIRRCPSRSPPSATQTQLTRSCHCPNLRPCSPSPRQSIDSSIATDNLSVFRPEWLHTAIVTTRHRWAVQPADVRGAGGAKPARGPPTSSASARISTDEVPVRLSATAHLAEDPSVTSRHLKLR